MILLQTEFITFLQNQILKIIFKNNQNLFI